MLRKKGMASVLIVVLVLMLGLAGCSSGGDKTTAPNNNANNNAGDKTITIKVGHVLAPDHPYTFGLNKFSEIVSQKTDGKIKVEVFHSSQLGNERDMIEALQLGTQEMALVSTAPLSSFTEQFLVFDLPFIFKDNESAYKVLDGEIGENILKSLESQGIVGLAYWENGFRHVTNAKRPINKPEDLKGLKIRLMENPIHMDTFSAMGASPTPMAFGELFTALQQGTIDGQENPIPIIWTSKFYEVQKQMSLTGHFYAAAPLLISQKFLNSLSPEYQKIIKDAAVEARDYERGLIAEQTNEYLDKIKGAGVNVVEVDKKLFEEAVKPVYSKYEAKIGKELIDKVISAQQ